jgi:PAS domain S-box-containing protein
MLTDIAEFKLAELERTAMQQLLWAITESMAEGLVLFDRSGVITFANGPAHGLLSWPDGTLAGAQVRELLEHGDETLLVARSTRGLERCLRRRDGERLQVAMTLVDNRHDRSGRQRIMVFRDVSHRRAAEAALAAKETAERANIAKNEFISRMSHELRTPLNAILGFGQLLSMAELPETASGNVEQIIGAGRRLLSLIDEVLDIARIESGNHEMTRQPVAVDAALAGAVALTRPMWDGAGIAVTVVPSIESLHVLADPRRFDQVLLNVLSNAIKYNRPDGSVTLSAVSGPIDRVTIRIVDDGVGIDPARIDRLFQPFQRLGAEGGEVGGTGLGLALTKAMVDAMGGHIDVQSEVGSGTAVTLSLEGCAAPAAGDEAHPAPALPKLAAGRRILYIEDDASNLALVEQILALDDVEVHAATSGADGLALARVDAPDLVLLDLDAALRAGEHTARLPVVVLSAIADRDLPARLEAIGAASYITKPLDIPLFLTTIKKVIEEHHGH